MKVMLEGRMSVCCSCRGVEFLSMMKAGGVVGGVFIRQVTFLRGQE